MRLFWILFLYATPTAPALHAPERLIFWQVVRGEWMSWVRDQSCDHFSLGGQVPDLKKFSAQCRGKTQRLWLPVAKPEHLKLLNRVGRSEEICIAAAPADLESKIPRCVRRPSSEVLVFEVPGGKKLAFRIPRLSMLIMGDVSPKEFAELPLRRSVVQNLLLAHHGRRAGLSQEMLAELPGLRRAFVSDLVLSRYQKRKSRLDEKSRRLLLKFGVIPHSTMEWGNIHYLLM